MEKQERIREIILQLKKIKEDLGLSNQDILEMVEANNDSTSPSTIHRLFAKDSENKNFNYRATIQPIFKAMTEIAKTRNVSDMDNDVLQAQLDALKQESLLKDTIIKDLQKELEAEQRKVAHLLIEAELHQKMLRRLLTDKAGE